jgi:predicted transposase/invertase (TIGR01784 family)
VLYEKYKPEIDKIVEIKYVQTIQVPDSATGKEMVVDVLCEDTQKRQYIVEMQLSPFASFEDRACAYLSRVYSQQLDAGMKYNQHRPVFLVAIVNNTLFKGYPGYRYDHKLLCEQTGQQHIKKLHLIFFDLTKFKKDNIAELKTMEEKWLYFFKHAPEVDINGEDHQKLIKHSAILKEAYTALDEASWTKDERLQRQQAQITAIDTDAAMEFQREEGRAEGEAKKERELVLAMHKGRMPAVEIAKWAKLPLEAVEKIIKDC